MKSNQNLVPKEIGYEPYHLLVVEDDDDIRALISSYLLEHGFKVSQASDSKEMDKTLASQSVDLIVLDVNLPGEDGFSICQRLSTKGAPAIILLTARGEDVDRILGIELGADDYLVKPFIPRELIARIGAVLRRSRAETSSGHFTKYSFDGFVVDIVSRRVYEPAGVRIILTSGEFEILLTLCQRPGHVFSRDELRSVATSERSVDITISRLRQKIESDPRDPSYIQTIRSIGYVFAAKVERQ
jgi:two-component system OmpR family response regulator